MLVNIAENQNRMTLTYPRTRHYIIIGVMLILIIGGLVYMVQALAPHSINQPEGRIRYWYQPLFTMAIFTGILINSLWQLRPDNYFTLDRMRGELRQGSRVAAFLHEVEGVEIHRERNSRRRTLVESDTYMLWVKLNNGRHIQLATSANSLSFGGSELEIRDLARRIASYLNVAVLGENQPPRSGLYF